MVTRITEDSRVPKNDLGPYRVGLVGDVHAEDALLEITLAYLRNSGVGAILCTGDVVDGWGNTERCCRMLREHGVATVLGNHDEWYLNGRERDLKEATPVGSLSTQAHEFVAALPRTLIYATPFGNVLLCHGLGENNEASVERSDGENAVKANVELQKLIADPLVQIVMNGHTHEAMVRHFAGLTIVNAGSLHRDYESGFMIVDLAAGGVDFLSVDGAGVGSVRRLGGLSAHN
jgi:predicted phosphodiesterase